MIVENVVEKKAPQGELKIVQILRVKLGWSVGVKISQQHTFNIRVSG
tara:strand:+ start:198 stop:338 length:141 start_codon:yes stop_codon:yes gene_type:complete